MTNRILFVCSKQNFLVKTVLQALHESFEVEVVEPDIVEIKLLEKLPDIFVVHLDDDVHSFNGTLNFLKEKLNEENADRVIYLIGTDMELEAAHRILPRTLVTADFLRPLNIGEIVKKISTLNLQGGIHSRRKRILIVDDDSVSLKFMKNCLSEKYDIALANSSVNAISFLAKAEADLILLDYEMPGANGLQVFEMLKSESRTAQIPVIFLTSKDDKETVMKVLAAHPEKYLLKNMDAESLVKSIDDFFKGK